jgi:hypothetical protein
MNQQIMEQPLQQGISSVQEQKSKLSLGAHLSCGWPLLLVLVGGLIGGACGGAAYALNVAIYKSNMAVGAKIALNIIVGLVAIAVWLFAAAAFHAAVNN